MSHVEDDLPPSQGTVGAHRTAPSAIDTQGEQCSFPTVGSINAYLILQ